MNVICIVDLDNAFAFLTFVPPRHYGSIHLLAGDRTQRRPTVLEALLAMKEDLEASIAALAPEEQDRLGEILIAHVGRRGNL